LPPHALMAKVANTLNNMMLRFMDFLF